MSYFGRAITIALNICWKLNSAMMVLQNSNPRTVGHSIGEPLGDSGFLKRIL